MKSTNVLVFTNTIPRFILDFGHLIDHLANHGFRSTIYAPGRKRETCGWNKKEVIESYIASLPPGTGVGDLPFDRENLKLLSLLRTLAFSRRLARRDPSCLVLFWTILPILVCGPPMRALNVRCVFMATGLGVIFNSDRLKYRLIRAVVMLFYRYLFKGRNSRVIVHNPEDKQYFVDTLGVRAENIQVTGGCGADPLAFPFYPQMPRRSKKVILIPSRLIVEKGILEAAEASGILRDRGIEHEMWFSSTIDPGNPSALDPRDLARLEAENQCIRFLGYQPTMAPIYEQCDILCLPSWYREGLPSPLIEAAACGRPAVACDNFGCRDIIRDGETGLMVKPRSATALADALERLIGDDDLAEKLRQNAYRQYLEKFTKDHMVALTVDVFRSLDLDIPVFELEGTA